jgi:hypothetical protein
MASDEPAAARNEYQLLPHMPAPNFAVTELCAQVTAVACACTNGA